MSAAALRPLSIGEVLDTSFNCIVGISDPWRASC